MEIFDRPETTLFMLSSVDGKITTGDTDILDTDADFPHIKGIKEGLNQYYQLEQAEQKTALFSLLSGRTMAKIGFNNKTGDVKKIPISFIIIDNKPHLNINGIDFFIKLSKSFYLVTTNRNHPAFKREGISNLTIIYYEHNIDFSDLFKKLKQVYQIPRIVIETGGTLNAVLLRNKLIDHISIVVAPAMIGGEKTTSLIGGESLHSREDLKHIKALNLKQCKNLEHSYLLLQYDVINDTETDL
jgi:2,5-diamino-6-(ribosylamino)-4(3H)-pyrimidinone 5'-phosphate reductase